MCKHGLTFSRMKVEEEEKESADICEEDGIEDHVKHDFSLMQAFRVGKREKD